MKGNVVITEEGGFLEQLEDTIKYVIFKRTMLFNLYLVYIKFFTTPSE